MEKNYKGLTFIVEEKTEDYSRRNCTAKETVCNITVKYKGLQIAGLYSNYYTDVISKDKDKDEYFLEHTREKSDEEITNFILMWKHAIDIKDTDRRVYIIKDEYDTDGGFGDAIPTSWDIGSVMGLFNAAYYCARYSEVVTIDKPYDYLTDGKLTYTGIPGLLNPEVKPFSSSLDEHDADLSNIVWNDDRFIKE